MQLGFEQAPLLQIPEAHCERRRINITNTRTLRGVEHHDWDAYIEHGTERNFVIHGSKTYYVSTSTTVVGVRFDALA